MSGAPDRVGAAESRQATDRLLGLLRHDGPLPQRLAGFAGATLSRSVAEIVSHPRAAVELSALHLAFLAARRPGGHRWILASWTMAATHLGLLGPRRSIGLATTVTLVRANAPALAVTSPWTGPAAVAADRLDGLVARRAGPTQFGHYADSLADAAFWTSFARRYETDRRWRIAAVAAWVAPVAAVTAVSVARGAMVEPPRPVRLRPAAAMQALLAARAVRAAGRWRSS